VQTINILLNTPKRNFYSLVRDPAQASYDDWQTKIPVPDFPNGFLEYTASQLQEYVTSHRAQIERAGNLEVGQFAVLDERSATDGTVVLWKELEKDLMKEEGQEEESESGEEGDGKVWRQWRVKFENSERIATDLDMTMEMWPVYCRDDLVGEDDVFNVKRAVEIFVNGG